MSDAAAPPQPPATLTGQCMCGAVRFEISQPLVSSMYCHCKRCQRRTGTAFAVGGITRPGSFAVTAGAKHVRTYKPEDGWAKSWCGECGSHLYAASADEPPLVSVRLGALDQDPGVRPSAHQFVDYAAAWLPLPDDGLPRFPERLPRG